MTNNTTLEFDPTDVPSTVTDDELLTISNLNISFGDAVPLFTPLSFSVKRGEIVVLIGASGVGKTSILRAIAGLLSPPLAIGRIQKTGAPSLVFQEDRLLPWCDLLSNALIPIALQRSPNPSEVQLARELLEMLGLSAVGQRLPNEVSGGMRQRVAIARALVRPSSLLLLDEPFNALDFDIKIKCQRLLLNHIRIQNVGCVLVTHDIDDAVSLATDIIRINAYPKDSIRIPIGWKDRPHDPLASRQTIEHFNLVKEILGHGL